MITINMLDPIEGGAYLVRDTLVYSGPVRTPKLFSWLRIEVRTSQFPARTERTAVRKVGSWNYQRTNQ